MIAVKKTLMFAAVLLIYICVSSLLLRYFYLYQQAYWELSQLISHPSIEISISEGGEK